MSVFVDTSAFLAVLNSADINHKSAERRWLRLMNSEESCATSNYVVLETSALLQNRIGLNALRAFHEDVLPVVNVYWVDNAIQRAALAALFVSGRRLSLVDCASFEIMRGAGIREAFTYDKHFKELGFTILV